MGDTVETRFRARNNTSAGIALQTLTVSGQAFSFSSRPTLPYIVAPGNFVEFRVTFAPLAPGSYSATLAVNGASFIVRAASVAAPVLSVVSDGPASILAAGAPIDFGRILKRTTASRTIRLANSSTQVLEVSAVTVSGQVFQGPGEIVLPAKIHPGAAVEFQLTFRPASAGAFSGSLSIDGRSFPLTGVAYEPPFPKPSIAISGPSASGSQPKLAIRFDEPPQLSGTGTLVLEFAGAADDPAIVFLNTGSRRLTFQVTEGDSTASFGSLKEAPLQTGTTAGTITFTVQLGDHTGKTTLAIAPAPVAIESAKAGRRASDLDITITGFDNTRTGGRFRFTFYDRSGGTVQPGAILLDATADFSRYFAISRVGGAFLTRVTFPVTGDAAQVGGVDVELINSAGTAKTQRLSFE
jgi:hypothetical protein